MSVRISAVEYVLARETLTNEDLIAEHPDWKVNRLSATTGFFNRSIAASDEYTSDIAIRAGLELFKKHSINPESIDYVILCTQSPDFPLPTTACLVQAGLGLRTDIGAVDINLGCSGYIYALGLAQGLIATGQVQNVLVVTAETHSKFVNHEDKATRPIFGDAAAASLVVADMDGPGLQGLTLHTDGGGGPSLVVPNGGLGDGERFSPRSAVGDRDLVTNGFDMYMDGVEIFNFTLREVPTCVGDILGAAGLVDDDIDFYIFHQANLYLIEHLRKKLEIDQEKFIVSLRDYGNTGSSTIPIALNDALEDGRIKPGHKVMMVGFGVGLSWGGAVVTW